MKRKGRKPQFTPEAIAAVMELRTDGVSWKLIQRHFGQGIVNAVRYARQAGVTYAP